MSDFEPYAGIYSGDAIADRTRGEVLALRAENQRLRAAQTALLEQNERFAVVIGELRGAIDKHNDECRECPVIEA